MKKNSTEENSVNDTGTPGDAPDRPGGSDPEPAVRHFATDQTRWEKEASKVIKVCWIRNIIGLFETSEQI